VERGSICRTETAVKGSGQWKTRLIS
jgi:hypothetical protein